MKKKKVKIKTPPPPPLPYHPPIVENATSVLREMLSDLPKITLSGYQKAAAYAARLLAAKEGAARELESSKGDPTPVEQDIARAEKFISEVKAAAGFYYLYEFAKRCVESDGRDYTITKIQTTLDHVRAYDEWAHDISRFDKDGALSSLMKEIKARLRRREWENGLRKKVMSVLALSLMLCFVGVSVLLAVLLPGISKLLFMLLDTAVLLLGIGAAVACYFVSIGARKLILPILSLSASVCFGVFLTIYLYNLGFSLWYISIFAAVLAVAATFSWGFGDSGYDVLVGGLGGVLIIYLLCGYIIVMQSAHYLRGSDFFDATFFGAIGNFFMGAWDILCGIMVGMAQLFMLAIGAGYWLPGFYSPLLLSGAFLNTLGYFAVVLFGVLMLQSIIKDKL